MPAATTFSHGLRSECANLPELLQILSTVLQTILTTGKPSRYNNGRDSIAYAASCGYGGIGRRARFRFWWETVQVQVLLTALLKSPVFTCFPVNTGLFYIKILF